MTSIFLLWKINEYWVMKCEMYNPLYRPLMLIGMDNYIGLRV